LIDAVNLICEFVEGNLPQGWNLSLTMNSEDASLELLDPNGDDVDIGTSDPGYSNLAQACDDARYLESQDESE
jgi:hypothetical protein